MSEEKGEYNVEYKIPVIYHPPELVKDAGPEWRCCTCKTRLGAMVTYRIVGSVWRMPHLDGAIAPSFYQILPCPRCGATNKRGAYEIKGVG